MPQFAANLSMMYPELPFLDRFEAAAQASTTPWAWWWAKPPRLATVVRFTKV
jgi:hydroxypyruvate isomerase